MNFTCRKCGDAFDGEIAHELCIDCFHASIGIGDAYECRALAAEARCLTLMAEVAKWKDRAECYEKMIRDAVPAVDCVLQELLAGRRLWDGEREKLEYWKSCATEIVGKDE